MGALGTLHNIATHRERRPRLTKLARAYLYCSPETISGCVYAMVLWKCRFTVQVVDRVWGGCDGTRRIPGVMVIYKGGKY